MFAHSDTALYAAARPPVYGHPVPVPRQGAVDMARRRSAALQVAINNLTTLDRKMEELVQARRHSQAQPAYPYPVAGPRPVAQPWAHRGSVDSHGGYPGGTLPPPYMGAPYTPPGYPHLQQHYPYDVSGERADGDMKGR